MRTKAEVQQQLRMMEEQEKQIWANLNYLLGQKSVLQTILTEMPDDPPVELPDNSGLPEEFRLNKDPNMDTDHCEVVPDLPPGVLPMVLPGGKKGK